MISYAQNYEDVILRRAFRDRTDGFYIDVGAMDPTDDSVTRFFYDQGWSGINIEPNRYFYERLLHERPRDINLNVALGEREETRTLHVFETFGNSTFDESYRDRFAEQGYEAEPKTVELTTLAAICRANVKQNIDFLKVDCEGWETPVLRGADWDQFRPTVVIVEATEPGTTTPAWADWEPLLTGNGDYEMVYFDGLNRFYLRRENLDLRSHFVLPPNHFDHFTRYQTIAAQHVANALRSERDALARQLSEVQTELQTRVTELEQRLLKTRLWVGQLSQELVASRPS